jgi:Domain of unknown function (DUF4282)
VGVGVSVIAGLVQLGNGLQQNARALATQGVQSREAASAIIIGLAILALGPLATRIFCELLILLFRMNETLSDIRAGLIPTRE